MTVADALRDVQSRRAVFSDEAAARRDELARARGALGLAKSQDVELSLDEKMAGRPSREAPKRKAHIAELSQLIEQLVADSASDSEIEDRFIAREAAARAEHVEAETIRYAAEARPLYADAVVALAHARDALGALRNHANQAEYAGAHAVVPTVAYQTRLIDELAFLVDWAAEHDGPIYAPNLRFSRRVATGWPGMYSVSKG
jgi:hypothetical protein